MTENRLEELLKNETRVLRSGNGNAMSIAATRAFWKAYDFLILFGIHTPEKLHELARRNMELIGGGLTFEESLIAVVWNANGHSKRILGIDCFGIGPSPSENGQNTRASS